MTEMPKPPPPVRVEPGVCPVPKKRGTPGACGEAGVTVLVITAFALYVVHGLVWPYSLPPTRLVPEPTGPEYWPGFLHLHELEIS